MGRLAPTGACVRRDLRGCSCVVYWSFIVGLRVAFALECGERERCRARARQAWHREAVAENCCGVAVWYGLVIRGRANHARAALEMYFVILQ